MPTSNDTNELDDDADFEDALPPGGQPDDASVDDGKPRGFSSAPPWARKAAPIAGVVLVLYLLFVWLPGRHHEASAPAEPKVTTTLQPAPDPLANRPKVNPIVSAVVGKDNAVRQKIADVVTRAEKQGGDGVLCSLYWGMGANGWSIEYQRPGGPALPNFTWNVPLFVDTHCFPTTTSPLIDFAAVPPVATTVPGGSGAALSNGPHPPLTPTGDQ